ncbi:MAG: Single-stranded-DNA-specific exonuclease RecJ [Betaproteobacteria bacterium ADurb.Bin341]|nr:MAG: Single-stranded-DNA-specific exonuclease RecJ [Betaproteobacteria bacterium ADurb.Bin341]
MTHLTTRSASPRQIWQLEQQGLHPLLARLYAARGVQDAADLDYALERLLPPASLTHAAEAATLLADAIEAEARLLIIADYDCDGATACAVGIRALRAFGAEVDYLVPDRFKLGYGLSPDLVDIAARREPDLIITVDNGIASIEGVARAREHGIATLITDHHLPGEALPEADCIVNPNQPGCAFASKNLAGVGVLFYVMLALRAELRARGHFAERPEPNLAQLLDLVALGTVADVVKLDGNNRILVSQGLQRMRAGRMQPGIAALFHAAGRNPVQATAFDLGFLLGPRLNAAGRLADMALGIECLITDDTARANNIAQRLDDFNQERRNIEASMREQALAILERMETEVEAPGIALFDESWHEGVIGILASRIKDKLHRPVFVFARSESGDLKGSGRSIAGLHLRDALDLIAKRFPDLLVRFGGHAMAAGVTLRTGDFERFRQLFAEVAGELIAPTDLDRCLTTDGGLETGYFSIEIARLLEREIWGQGFPAPLFVDEFEVEEQKVLKEKHLKLKLRKGAMRIDAIQFNFSAQPGSKTRAAYRLEINDYMGVQRPQLVIEYLE